MNKDRELLELAAKANGLCGYLWTDEIDDWDSDHFGSPAMYPDDIAGQCRSWNPLVNDGDCARMEAHLKLSVEWCGSYVIVTDSDSSVSCSENFISHENEQAARRMASLRVAAEIGKAMP